MRVDQAFTAIMLCLCVSFSACGDAGPRGMRGSSCSMQQAEDGSVLIRCDDGTNATLRPPQPGTSDAGRAEPCRFERSVDSVRISCPDGSSATIPTGEPPAVDGGTRRDGAASNNCQVDETPNGNLTITCPDGTSATLPATPSEPASSTRLVGASAAACGACHDATTARAHFQAMSIDLDGGVRESCGTCHAESGIRPVSLAHMRPELGGPGLVLAIEAASVDPQTRAVSVQLRLSDRQGAALSREGIDFNFLVAQVGSVTAVDGITTLAGPYQNYLTRSVTQQDHPAYPLGSAAPRTVSQPTTEAGTGSFSELAPGSGDGRYLYRFQYALPEGYAAGTTHLVALHASRTLAGVRFVADATHFFVPSDALAVPIKRDAVHSGSCNTCHAGFRAHGGSVREVQVCLGCHTQGSVDAESNHSLDFNVMIHRIHRGKALPSVQGGTPYDFVAEQQKGVDFSHVGYPQPIENCQSCHTSGDSDRWVTNGARAVCTSCHELIDKPWEQGGHPFALEPDANCSNGNCHGVGGRVRDAREAHLTFLNDPRARVFKLELLSASVVDADSPVRLRVRARVGRRNVADAAFSPVSSPQQLASLDVFLNGPNTGYLASGNTLRHYAKAALVDLAADPAAAGELTFELPESLRLSVAGLGDPEIDSYTVSVGASFDPTPGATPDDDRTPALNQPALALSASESLVARRSVVSTESCNDCHGGLRKHGDEHYASSVEQCAMCHTASLDTRLRQSARGELGLTQSLRFGTMVHRIHGEGIATRPYVLYGDGASGSAEPYPRVDYSSVPFSGDVRACQSCHSLGTYFLPLSDTEPATITTILSTNEALGVP